MANQNGVLVRYYGTRQLEPVLAGRYQFGLTPQWREQVVGFMEAVQLVTRTQHKTPELADYPDKNGRRFLVVNTADADRIISANLLRDASSADEILII